MKFILIFLSCLLSVSLTAVDVKKVKVGEIKIAYYTRGKGQPLVMINGFKATMADWDPLLLSLLEKNYLLILFDNRGVGQTTDTLKDNTSIHQMADDTAGLIKALKFDSAYVLGWSMGARIAQQLTIRYPELVAKLILCAPNAGGSHQIPTPKDVLKKLSDPNDHSPSLFFPNTPEGLAAAEAVKNRLKDAVDKGTAPKDFQVNKQAIARLSKARGELWDASNANFEDLAKIRIPVLITDGKDDIIDPPGNAMIVANQIPFSWRVFFDGGHAFLFQYAERFAALVHLFLE